MACCAAKAQLTIHIEDADVICGDTFYLSIRGSQLSGIAAATLYIDLDSTHFRYSNDDWGVSAGQYRHSLLINPILDTSECLGVVSVSDSGSGQWVLALGWFHYFQDFTIDDDWMFKIRLINVCEPISVTPIVFPFSNDANYFHSEINNINGAVVPCDYFAGVVSQLPLSEMNDSSGGTTTTCQMSVNAGPDQGVSLHYSCPSVATINATIGGGSAPYDILWSNGASSPGIIVTPEPPLQSQYSVTVTDAEGCIATDVVQLQWYTLPAQWSLTQAATMNACPGDISFPIRVFFTDSVTTISLHLAYDTTVLTYTGFQDALPAIANTVSVNAANGIISIGWTGTAAMIIEYEKLLERKCTGTGGKK